MIRDPRDYYFEVLFSECLFAFSVMQLFAEFLNSFRLLKKLIVHTIFIARAMKKTKEKNNVRMEQQI